MPGCSVIVCTRYRPDLLARCLASLAGMDGPEPETIVVDNTEGDPETKRVTARAGARYVVETRGGLSRARNTGIDAGRGELIAFLDDDAVADSAWLSRHAAALADESLTAATGRELPVVTEPGQGWIPPRGLDLGEQAFVIDRRSPGWFERANFGGLGSGANMVFKRQAFDQGLRFRETLGRGADLPGFEEHYIFFRIIKSGGRIAYVPGAVVWHGRPDSSGASAGDPAAHKYRENGAYMTMLLVEEPRLRRLTASYVLQGFLGQPLPWRQRPQSSRLKMLAAGASGSFHYVRSRLGRARARES